MRITKNMHTEAMFIRMLKNDKKDDKYIVWAIAQLGSNLPRAVVREMIAFHDEDKTAFTKQMRKAEGGSKRQGKKKTNRIKGAYKSLSLSAFRKLVAGNDLGAHEHKLLKIARVGHQLIVGAKLTEKSARTRSRFRGRPALATDDAWPTWKSSPMEFLLQIDLAKIPKRATGMFPASGLLSFFCALEWDYASPDAGRILYHKSTRGLSLRDTPDGVEEHPPRAMRIVPNTLCVPPQESRQFKALRIKGEALDCYDALSHQVRAHQKPNGAMHQLLGYPDQIQGDIEEDANDIARARKKWSLALQLGTDKALGTEWGDEGNAYFMLPEKKRTKPNYADCCLIMQCY
jgi:uncharacterized protein YwqG